MMVSNKNFLNTFPKFLHLLTDKFILLHGDRTQGDDRSVCGGLAWIENRKFILISLGVQTNHSIEKVEKQTVHRKIIRLLNLAKQLKRPVLLIESKPLLDVYDKGILAFSSINSVIQTVKVMSHLTVPIIGILSGNPTTFDSLAIGMADFMMAPSGFEVMIKEISNKTNNRHKSHSISEFTHVAFTDDVQTISAIRKILPSKVDELLSIPTNDLVSQRIARLNRLSHLIC